MSHAGNFGLVFYKNYYHIWNQHPRIFLITKFREIMKMPKFRTKNAKCGTRNALFWYFRAEICKQYCHVWNQSPWFYLNAKFREIRKMSKFGTKNAFIRCFWARISKKLQPYLKSAPSNLSNCKIFTGNRIVSSAISNKFDKW